MANEYSVTPDTIRVYFSSYSAKFYPQVLELGVWNDISKDGYNVSFGTYKEAAEWLDSIFVGADIKTKDI